MGTIPTTTAVNVNDLTACIYAIQDGNAEIAQEIIQEYLAEYYRELEESYDESK